MSETPLAPHSWAAFCAVADALAQTSKRLEKAAIFATYGATLDDDTLARACGYLSGHVFAQWDQRVLQIGGSLMLGVLAQLSAIPAEALKPRWVTAGDLGELAAQVLPTGPETLTVLQVADAFEALAAARGAAAKGKLLLGLLSACSPREAKYIVKLVSDSLRIGFQEGAVEDALARLYQVPVERVQWANLLLGDLGKTARLARHGQLDEARMRLFHPLKFMLATAAQTPEDITAAMPDGFIVEDKFDGIRCQAHISCATADPSTAHGTVHDGVRVALFSRTLDEITPSFPDLIPSLSATLRHGSTTQSVLLDGEILPMHTDGTVLPFQDLQKRLGRKKPTEELCAQVPVVFVAYDILYLNEKLLIDLPWRERRAALESIEVGDALMRVTSTFMRDIQPLDAEFAAAKARGNEGLMVKDPLSPYKPGRRGGEWLKVKRAQGTLDVVVTAVEVGSGKRRHLLSDYTFAVRQSPADATLLNIGKAYSGLTDQELTDMSVWFREHTLQEFAHGKVRTVEPSIVIEVAFDRVQVSARHKSGYALRFPRIVRLRPDKRPEDIDTLAAVAALVQA